MATYLYRNSRMEQDLLDKINDLANRHFNEDVPLDVQERIATETRHIIASGRGTLLAAAASLAEFSAAHGYPVGIRGISATRPSPFSPTSS